MPFCFPVIFSFLVVFQGGYMVASELPAAGLLVASWVMAIGFAVMLSVVWGTPMGNIKKLHAWVFRTIRHLIGGMFRKAGNIIDPPPKKKKKK